MHQSWLSFTLSLAHLCPTQPPCLSHAVNSKGFPRPSIVFVLQILLTSLGSWGTSLPPHQPPMPPFLLHPVWEEATSPHHHSSPRSQPHFFSFPIKMFTFLSHHEENTSFHTPLLCVPIRALTHHAPQLPTAPNP